MSTWTLRRALVALISFVYIFFLTSWDLRLGLVGRLQQQASSVSNTLASTMDHQHEYRLPRLLAIYFPQFHRDPLNDRLWGDGFTDWTSLRAAPLHNRLGWRIPRPTSDLGYYDLLNMTVRQKQGQLAKQYGIDGFVYHHYWFYDTPSQEQAGENEAPPPPLSRSLLAMLGDNQPDIPFCFHWCNFGWAQKWNSPAKVASKSPWLQTQRFPVPGQEDEIRAHYQWLRPFFHHPNYIKVNGEPVLMIYKWMFESIYTLQTLRQLAKEDGFPNLYIPMGNGFTHDELFPKGRGEGEPRWRPPFKDLVNQTVSYPYPHGVLEGKSLRVPDWCLNRHQGGSFELNASSSSQIIRQMAGLMTSFDNTPRRQFNESHIWSQGAPDVVVQRFYDSVFAAVYYETCCVSSTVGDDEKIIVINAWNEWAEGMALEPSDVFGYQFLDAVSRAKAAVRASQCQMTNSSSSTAM